MVSADVTSDDNIAKGKREAPMAEPSTEYLPPRLEAPYATYQPILAGSNSAQQGFYQQSPFNQIAATPAPAPAYEYSRYAGVLPLQTVDNNDLGNGLHPGPPYSGRFGSNGGYANANANANGNFNSNINTNTVQPNGNTYTYGSYIKYNQNGFPTSYAQFNGLGQHLQVYNGNGYENNAGNLDQYSTIKNNHFDGSNSGYDNSFYGNPSFTGSANKYPSSAALISNEPVYASGIKGLGHYSSTIPVSNLNTQTLKNSRPVALTPVHQQRKPSTFLSESRSPNFRPSFLLGSQVLSSTPDYNNQPTLTSLGTGNQYIPPTQQIPQEYAPQSIGNLPLAQREYFPSTVSDFGNNYQTFNQPDPSYGLPETIIYTKSSLFGEQYGPPQ